MRPRASGSRASHGAASEYVLRRAEGVLGCVERILGRGLPDDARRELLRGMKRDDAALGDRYLLAASQVARPALRASLRLKASEALELHRFTGFERDSHLLEDGIHHLAAFAFGKADVLEEQVLQLFLR